MNERDAITQEPIGGNYTPPGDNVGAIGSVRVEDLQNAGLQPPAQPYAPAAAPVATVTDQERHWMAYAQQKESENRILKQKADEFDRFNSNLQDPNTRQRFMQAWEVATNPHAPLPSAPPPAANMPPPAAQAPPSAQAPPQIQYHVPPEFQRTMEALDQRTQRIEVQNAQVELQSKLAQMRGKFGNFDEMAVLEIAQSRNIQEIGQLEDAYMTWNRYVKNGAGFMGYQPNQGQAPPPPMPQGYRQYPQGYPQQAPQYGGYAPPPAQMPPAVQRVVPPPTGSSVPRGDYPAAATGAPMGPMSKQQRDMMVQQRYSGALQHARATIPPGRN